jgi:hypothetical protein
LYIEYEVPETNNKINNNSKYTGYLGSDNEHDGIENATHNTLGR